MDLIEKIENNPLYREHKDVYDAENRDFYHWKIGSESRSYYIFYIDRSWDDGMRIKIIIKQ